MAANNLPMPLGLLVLDLIGCIFMGLGLALQFSGVDIVPPHLRFERDGLVYIVVGLGCFMPPVFYLINKNRQR